MSCGAQLVLCIVHRSKIPTSLKLKLLLAQLTAAALCLQLQLLNTTHLQLTVVVVPHRRDAANKNIPYQNQKYF